MVNKLVIILCIAAVIIGTAGKPIKKGSGMQSTLKLKLTKHDLNRGVSIDITSAKKDQKLMLHLLPIIEIVPARKLDRSENKVRRGRRINPTKRRQMKKFQAKFFKALVAEKDESENNSRYPYNTIEKSVITPNTRLMRNKRSLPLKNVIGNSELQVEDLRQLIEDNENGGAEDYSEEKPSQGRRINSYRVAGKNQQQQYFNTEDYHDYAFDTTEADQFNEEDDLLRQYYGQINHERRAIFNDYDSFSDLMHQSADQINRNTRNEKGLYYGDNDSVLNDEDDINDNIDSEYDEYYDDDDSF